MNFRSRSIVQYLVAFAAALAVPLFALLAYQAVSRYETEQRRAEETLRTLAQGTAFETRQFIGRVQRLLTQLSDTPLVSALNPQQCDPRLGEFANMVPQAVNLFTLDAQGQLVCSVVTPTPGAPRTVSPTYYFAQAQRTRAFTVGKPAVGFITGKWVVTMAQPILDAGGQFRGTVNLAIDLLQFAEARGGGGLPPGAVMGLVNTAGTLIWRFPEPEKWVGVAPAAFQTLRRGFAQEVHPVVTIRGPDGIERLIASRAVQGTDWVAFVGFPTDEIYGPNRLQALLSAAAALLTALMAGFASIFIGRRIAEPVKRVAESARQIASGNLEARAARSGLVEIDTIARELNETAGAQQAARAASDQAARLLARSEARFRAVFEQSQMGISLTDPVSGKIDELNQHYADILGRTREALTGADWMGFTHPDDLAQNIKDRAQLRSGAVTGISREKRYLRPDGTTVWVHLTVTPVQVAGADKPYFMAMVRDISQRKAAEAALAQHRDHLEELVATRTSELAVATARADAASQAKSDFLAHMSHEIRTPLGALLGFTHLLRRLLNDPAQFMHMDRIQAAAQHLQVLINDILDLSKIEANKLVLEALDTDVPALVTEVGAMLASDAAARGLSLETEIAPMPGHLIGDATRIRQALLNLAGNAVKFTTQGSVTLRAWIEEETGEQVRIRFEVADTGPGLAPEVLSRLFTPFQQADDTTSRHFGGTGLGLSITKSLAALMGGEVGAVSTPGEGSTFWFTAYLQKGTGTPAEKPAVNAAGEKAELVLRRAHQGRRILLVEDDKLSQEAAREMLESAGLDVDVASDGLYAVQAVQQQGSRPYDLILMDMQMPRLNGLEATRKILQMPAAASVPIVAMTANAFAEDRALCLAAGMRDFIAKPVRPDLLYTMLLKWITHK